MPRISSHSNVVPNPMGRWDSFKTNTAWSSGGDFDIKYTQKLSLGERATHPDKRFYLIRCLKWCQGWNWNPKLHILKSALKKDHFSTSFAKESLNIHRWKANNKCSNVFLNRQWVEFLLRPGRKSAEVQKLLIIPVLMKVTIQGIYYALVSIYLEILLKRRFAR